MYLSGFSDGIPINDLRQFGIWIYEKYGDDQHNLPWFCYVEKYAKDDAINDLKDLYLEFYEEKSNLRD